MCGSFHLDLHLINHIYNRKSSFNFASRFETKWAMEFLSSGAEVVAAHNGLENLI